MNQLMIILTEHLELDHGVLVLQKTLFKRLNEKSIIGHQNYTWRYEKK